MLVNRDVVHTSSLTVTASRTRVKGEPPHAVTSARMTHAALSLTFQPPSHPTYRAGLATFNFHHTPDHPNLPTRDFNLHPPHNHTTSTISITRVRTYTQHTSHVEPSRRFRQHGRAPRHHNAILRGKPAMERSKQHIRGHRSCDRTRHPRNPPRDQHTSRRPRSRSTSANERGA